MSRAELQLVHFVADRLPGSLLRWSRWNGLSFRTERFTGVGAPAITRRNSGRWVCRRVSVVSTTCVSGWVKHSTPGNRLIHPLTRAVLTSSPVGRVHCPAQLRQNDTTVAVRVICGPALIQY